MRYNGVFSMKSSSIVFNRDIPVKGVWDVIVIGGGPSGCAAAISSAREGARTLLLEATGSLGGMATSGLVPTFCPFTDKLKPVYRGLALKVLAALVEDAPHIKPGQYDWIPIDAEKLKRVYDRMVLDSGSEILFNSFLCGVEKSGEGTVSSAIVANKDGLAAYNAKVFVDCSGDADLAAWSGAEFQKGDGKSGDLQPATLCFILGNVDEYAYRFGPDLYLDKDSPIYQILASGEYPHIKDNHICQVLVGPRTVGFNAGHIWDVDNTDPVSVSMAMVEGRKIADEMTRALAKYVPKAFANAHLTATAPLMGARETRRIIGDYTLVESDYYERRSFPDEIGRNCYWLDLHTSKGEIEKSRKGLDHLLDRIKPYAPGESHGIPYRCLTPGKLDNVLVAGRSISCDRIMQSSLRIMPSCLVTGEAAGMAAAHAADGAAGNVHKIDVERLRSRLKAAGAFFE